MSVIGQGCDAMPAPGLHIRPSKGSGRALSKVELLSPLPTKCFLGAVPILKMATLQLTAGHYKSKVSGVTH